MMNAMSCWEHRHGTVGEKTSADVLLEVVARLAKAALSLFSIKILQLPNQSELI